MSQRKRSAGAFTLVELLAVIAILALLVSMLMPVLGRARDMARRAQCQTNLRTIGTGIQAFAAIHEGRAPGHAISVGGSGGFYGFLYSERTIPRPVQTTGDTLRKGYLGCSSLAPNRWWWDSARSLLLNRDLEGGPHPHPHTPDNPPQEGPYGKLVIPPPADWDFYTLGARLQGFPQPQYQIALWEAGPVGTDYTQAYGDPLLLRLGIDPSRPPWAGDRGYYAFRHVLPADPRQYQTQATACFLFIDAHVEVLTAMTNVAVAERFRYRP